MIKEKEYKVGDTVRTTITKKGSNTKVEVTGVIKEIKNEFGNPTYIIEGGSVGEFKARKIFPSEE